MWKFCTDNTLSSNLEEIDLIFLTGYVEGRSYVSVGNSMPKMSEAEITAESQRLQQIYAQKSGNPEAVLPTPGAADA